MFNVAFVNAFQISCCKYNFIGYVNINAGGRTCFCGSCSDYNKTTGTTATSAISLLSTVTQNCCYYTNSGVSSVTNTSSFQYHALLNTSGGYVTTTLFKCNMIQVVTQTSLMELIIIVQ